MKKFIFFLICFWSYQVFGSKNFVLISAPGSGKGTFSQYLVEKHGYVQICPGDIFRSEIRAQTELGKKIQPIVEKGEYVDEAIVCELISSSLLKIIQENKNFIIDGFPRSTISFDFLYQFLQKHNVIKDVIFLQLQASDAVCINRILERKVCTQCFKVYNDATVQPKDANKCDDCKIELVLRKADNQELTEKRLLYFHAHVEPLMKQAEPLYTTQIIQSESSIQDLQVKYDQLLN